LDDIKSIKYCLYDKQDCKQFGVWSLLTTSFLEDAGQIDIGADIFAHMELRGLFIGQLC
jgi:hypothetical protein